MVRRFLHNILFPGCQCLYRHCLFLSLLCSVKYNQTLLVQEIFIFLNVFESRCLFFFRVSLFPCFLSCVLKFRGAKFIIYSKSFFLLVFSKTNSLALNFSQSFCVFRLYLHRSPSSHSIRPKYQRGSKQLQYIVTELSKYRINEWTESPSCSRRSDLCFMQWKHRQQVIFSFHL